MPLVNDLHSALNPTDVAEIVRPTSAETVSQIIRSDDKPLCIAGGRHAMGSQQFGTGMTLLDLSAMDRVIGLDQEQGIIEVEAGIQWPALIEWLGLHGDGWGIVQKQTGADRLSLGGALSANIHGRGLAFRAFVQDIESFDLVDSSGSLRHCSRSENADWFRLAIGGYGLVGVITSLRLRLNRRHRLERLVEITTVDSLMEDFERQMRAGCRYGDFQFMTDETSDRFMREGVFSCYRPVEGEASASTEAGRSLGEDDWRRLYRLSHTDRGELYRVYADFYRSTHGQQYWSDTHQLSVYLDGYHADLDRELGAAVPGSEMISELYVPRWALADFCREAGQELRRRQTPVIYGTIRLIEREDETFLAWARESWACIIVNLCVRHSPQGIQTTSEAFRALIDLAASFGGSYYLTYHRWSQRHQVERCHPRMRDFIDAKRALDPRERFQSDWYRHHREMFGITA